MSVADWIGSLGVGLLLVAFGFSAFGKLSQRAPSYHALNLLGASLAAWASWQIRFWPFVVLEGVWAAVALAALARR